MNRAALDVFYKSLGRIAPYYSFVLGIIALILFHYLFKSENKKIYLKPWRYLHFAVVLFMVEEFLAILMGWGIYIVPHFTFGFLEIGMITSFIYMVLLEKEHLKKGKK